MAARAGSGTRSTRHGSPRCSSASFGLRRRGWPRALFHAAVFGVTRRASALVPAVAAAVGSAPRPTSPRTPTGTRSAARTRSTRSRCCSIARSKRSSRERQGVEDLYFVGVAGYAAEDVFMKEMAVVRELFRERFDADGRMVTLVNNPKTVAQLPVASATALARTLDHLGGGARSRTRTCCFCTSPRTGRRTIGWRCSSGRCSSTTSTRRCSSRCSTTRASSGG